MAARVILVPKVNSHPFDDRVLLLEVPCKIGRAHKDDQVNWQKKKKYFDEKKKSFSRIFLPYLRLILEMAFLIAKSSRGNMP